MVIIFHTSTFFYSLHFTLSENENEWQKTEQVPIQIPRAASTFFDEKKKLKKKSANLDFRDNPIYPIWDPDGRDIEFIFLGEKVRFL